LGEDETARVVHRIGDGFPAFDLRVGEQTRHSRPAATAFADEDAFADDETCRGALPVILGHQRRGNVSAVGGASSGQRRHDDPIPEVQIANPVRRHQRTIHCVCGAWAP
jgi:hypothetical protein